MKKIKNKNILFEVSIEKSSKYQDTFALCDLVISKGDSLVFFGRIFHQKDEYEQFIKGIVEGFKFNKKSPEYESFEVSYEQLYFTKNNFSSSTVKRGVFNKCVEYDYFYILDKSLTGALHIKTLHFKRRNNNKSLYLNYDIFSEISLYGKNLDEIRLEEERKREEKEERERQKRLREARKNNPNYSKPKPKKHYSSSYSYQSSGKKKNKGFLNSIGKDLKSIGGGFFSAGKAIFSSPKSSKSKSHKEESLNDRYYSGPRDKIHASHMDWSSNKAIYYDDDGNEYTLEGDTYVKK